VYNGLQLDDWIHATEQFERRAVTERAHEQAMEQRRKIAVVQGRVADAIALSDSLIDREWFVGSIMRMLVMQSILEEGYDDAASRMVAMVRDSLAGTLGSVRHPEAEPVWTRYNAECSVEIWNLQHGDTTTVRTSLRFMEQMVDEHQFLPACPLLLNAMLAAVRGEDVPGALDRLESYLITDEPGLVTAPMRLANLVASRLREQQGDLEGALAAIRRRGIGGPNPNLQIAFPALLREEGRLAALAGDTAGAANAYQHYLTLRTDPDPVLEAEVDAVRSALTALVGEGNR
jgi:RNase P/RNase MRP subunit POP5